MILSNNPSECFRKNRSASINEGDPFYVQKYYCNANLPDADKNVLPAVLFSQHLQMPGDQFP